MVPKYFNFGRKDMMLKRFMVLAMVLAFSMLSFSCGDGSDGGAGAEFDASLYYTKSEVYSKTEVDAMVPEIGSGSGYIAGTGWDNRAESSGNPVAYAVPTGAKSAIFEIFIQSAITCSPDDVDIKFATSETFLCDFQSITGDAVDGGGHMTIHVDNFTGASNLYVYVETSGTLSFGTGTILVKDKVWFK